MNDLLAPSGVSARLLPDAQRGRILTRPEMADLARRISSDPDLWREHVRYSEDRRHFVSLHRDSDVEVWLICWTPDSDTGWHDHDSSSGAVAVAEGSVVEHRLAIGRPEIERVARDGESFSFAADHIHRMGAGGPSPPPCTSTARRCGGWVSTPSTTRGCSGGSRCRTPTSCARSTPPELGVGRSRRTRPLRPPD